MLPFYHILIPIGVVILDFTVVYVAWRLGTRDPVRPPKVADSVGKRKLSRRHGRHGIDDLIEGRETDMW